MLKDLKKTSKHTAVYALGNISMKIVGLILIPIYTNKKYLSEADFGALAILEASSQLLVSVFSLAMIQSLTRWYWDAKYKQEQKSVFFTTYAFLSIIIVPLLVLFYLFPGNIAMALFKTEDYTYLIKLVIISSGLIILNNQALCLAKVQSRSILYSSLQIFKLALILVLILWGIVYRGKGLDAIWEANVIGEGVLLLLMTPYVWKNMVIKFNKPMLFEMISYGFPLMLASVSGIILSVTDRYMLNSMSGLEETGVYALGLRIANTLKIGITTSLALAFSPLRMKKMHEPNNQRFYAKILSYSGFIFTVAMLGLSLFSLEILKVFTSSTSYWKANGVVAIISLSLFFGLLKDNVVIGLTIKKQTKVIGLLIFITSIFNVGLNFFLIPIWDIYGAALATTTSQVFLFLLILFYAQKAYKIPYELKKIGLLIVISGIFIAVGIGIAEMEVFLRLLIKLLLFLSFPFVLLLLNYYDPLEKEALKNIFREWKSPSKFTKNIKRFFH